MVWMLLLSIFFRSNNCAGSGGGCLFAATDDDAAIFLFLLLLTSRAEENSHHQHQPGHNIICVNHWELQCLWISADVADTAQHTAVAAARANSSVMHRLCEEVMWLKTLQLEVIGLDRIDGMCQWNISARLWECYAYAKVKIIFSIVWKVSSKWNWVDVEFVSGNWNTEAYNSPTSARQQMFMLSASIISSASEDILKTWLHCDTIAFGWAR